MANNHEEKDPSQSLKRRTPGGFGIFPNNYATTLNGMYFGGIATHSDGSVGKTHLIDPQSSFITQEDVLSPGFGKSYPGGHVQAYQDVATRLSGAAGKIYLDLCGCHGLKGYHTSRAEHQKQSPWLQHPKVCMSGFWIQGARFITSAHFSQAASLTTEETQNTEAYLKAYSTSDQPKAVVCSGGKVPKEWHNATKAISVYLLKLDRDSDLAIFQAYHDGDAPPGLLRSDITTIAQCDPSQSAFTIGYHRDDPPIHALQAFDMQVLTTFWPNDDGTRPQTYFPVKCAGVRQMRDSSLQFADIFPHPDHRVISAGDIGNVYSTQRRSTFFFCQISAWYQSSGGMVGGFVQSQVKGQARNRPAVFGVFRGDQGPKNVVAAFTAEGIDWLFE